MIIQIIIAVLGASAIYLVSIPNAMRKYGYVLGLLAQPLWFYETWKNEQWGIFALCVAYTISWANGIKNHFNLHIHWYSRYTETHQVTRNFYQRNENRLMRKCRCGKKQMMINGVWHNTGSKA